ncbi:hypothetical protein [Saccharicrinis aurantiacus]|uniref:hypothetical protein n=1 Tax=Saccharicrinis aurantiacus TaxID=1849719 RepID=UPI00248F6155|nr:hypothetical protein [Saccharicrinis aurantiacus]
MSKIYYKIYENAITGYLLTVKIEDSEMSFNHQNMHAKEEYESFEADDLGIEVVNGIKMRHINGKILNEDEYEFLERIIEDIE